MNLRSDKALRGILWNQRGSLLVLKDVELLEPGRQAVGVDGEVIVDAANIDFVQVLDGAG